MKSTVLTALLPVLLCGCLRTEIARPTNVVCVTNLSGYAISCHLNTNAFAGGDRLVLTCTITNTSSSPVTIDTPDLDDAWSIRFDTAWYSTSGPFPPRLPTPRTNTLLRGEGLLVVKDYTVPEGISHQAWREAVRAAQDNRAEHYSRFVPQIMSEEEFAAFAAKALPTNIPPSFSFQTTLCLPIITSTTSYTFVDVKLSDIPIRMTEEAEQNAAHIFQNRARFPHRLKTDVRGGEK